MTAKGKVVAAVVLLTAIGQWVVLSFQIPLLQFLFPWQYRWLDRPMTHAWLFALLCALAFGVNRIVHSTRAHPGKSICLIVALGYVAQLTFLIMGGQGFGRHRRWVNEFGHGEFVRVAARDISVWQVLTDYDRQLEGGQLCFHARTKPPGTVLFYLLTQRISNLVRPETSYEGRLERLTLFISVVYPLLGFLALPLLYHLCRYVVSVEQALAACVVYASAPNLVAAYTLHLDAALYPSLFLLCLCLALHSYRANSFMWSLVAGVTLFLATFASFSLLPACPFSCLLLLCYHGYLGSRGDGPKRLGRALIGLALGTLCAGLAFRLLLNYDAWARFRDAVALHEQYKAWEPGFRRLASSAFQCCAELAFYVGAPISLLFLTALLRAAGNAWHRRPGVFDTLAACCLVVVLYLAVFGRTTSETSRLWLFMVPVGCLFVGREIGLLWRAQREWGVLFVLLTNLVTALALVRY